MTGPRKRPQTGATKRGDASKTLDIKEDPNKNYKNLQKAMEKLFKNYPPQANK